MAKYLHCCLALFAWRCGGCSFVLMKLVLHHFLWFLLLWTNLYALTRFLLKICYNLYCASNAFSNSFQQFNSLFIQTEYHCVALLMCGLVPSKYFTCNLSLINVLSNTLVLILALVPKDEWTDHVNSVSALENTLFSLIAHPRLDKGVHCYEDLPIGIFP